MLHHLVILISTGLLLTVYPILSLKPEVITGRISEVTSVQNRNSDTTSVPYLNCSGSYWVGFVAKLISIPYASNGTRFSCRWLLKASEKTQTIALSTVNTTVDLEGDNVSFKLEARDGWSADSPVIATLEWKNSQLTIEWPFIQPIKASSGFLLLQYTTTGQNPLQMDFVYYACGGRAVTRTYLQSPVFTGLSLMPEIVDCQWEFTKPKKALYGYLRLLDVNISDCSILQMRSNASMQVIEKVTKNPQSEDLHNSSVHVANSAYLKELENFIKWAKKKTNFTYKKSQDENEKTKNRTIVPVCGNNTKMVVFSCTKAKLRFQLSQQQIGFGFKAYFSPFSVPDKLERRKNTIPWYYNYCALTIFTPIGILIGLTIILYQTRKRGPTKSQLDISSSYDDSESLEKKFRTVNFRRSVAKCGESDDSRNSSPRSSDNALPKNSADENENILLTKLSSDSTQRNTSENILVKQRRKGGILRKHSPEWNSENNESVRTEIDQNIPKKIDNKHVRFERLLSATNRTQSL